ncbi:MAG: C45 family autoproteolytic acyltransferase/hydrolase [Zhenhengia sp.]|jgi:hypothetical protein|uniref:C45 family autoproteolytic acyltransferase/hydolase n=1 Tax=Zhenhengia sp. TaxID=2944208 RepID=UPI00291539AE|nr:C45 family peptidase [Clostridiales bacterium]MDU6973054.1 C45 family peptidase [Clostridiales bacterium]
MKKILKITGISIGSILLVAVLGLGIIFSGEIRTLLTFKQLNDQPFYEMTYHADYGLDEFLEQGAATDDELVSFVTKKILKGVSFEVNPDGACSTFIATTPEGDDLFGRNFDYVPSIGLIVRTAPKNGYESLSVVNLNHLGLSQENMPTKNLLNRIITLAAPYAPLDGMNEKGLSIGVLVINKGIVHQSTGKVPITTTSAIRMILDKAATVDEAIALLEKYDMNSSGDTGYHFQIADAEGNTAIVEYIDNEMHVLTKEEGYTAATNFVLYNDMNEGSGQDRYEAIKAKQAETGGIMTEDEALELLLSVPSQGIRVIEGLNEEIESDTQWSCVYNLDDLTMQICTGRDRERIYNYKLER